MKIFWTYTVSTFMLCCNSKRERAGGVTEDHRSSRYEQMASSTTEDGFEAQLPNPSWTVSVPRRINPYEKRRPPERTCVVAKPSDSRIFRGRCHRGKYPMAMAHVDTRLFSWYCCAMNECVDERSG